MRLQTQIAVAFFLLAVVPLFGVTIYTNSRSEAAIGHVVQAEANAWADEMEARVNVVKDVLEKRIARMRDRPTGEPESPFERARRDALAGAQDAQLRIWLRSMLTDADRRRGAIPFAIDAQGRLYVPEANDAQVLAALGIVRGPAAPVDAGDWVVAVRSVKESGIQIGVVRPVSAAIVDLRRTAARNLALGLALALVAGLGSVPLSRRMTRHLASLTAGAERLAAGDLDVQVKVPHSRELARLALTFNRMARELRASQQRLVERERLRKELEIGRRIQEELLPRGPLSSAFAEMRGVSMPAREVGGDFFNYFSLSEDEVAILVGDVSGKGVGAALLMASLQATIRARLTATAREAGRLAAGCDLAALVEELDGDMENDEPLAPYFTMFLAVVDGSRGLVRYVNAGHNTQFVVSPDGRVEQLPSTGRPPGLYPGGGYEERSAPLREGDALVLFTDGLVEAEDESGEPFGAGRLEALLRVHVAEGLSELLGHVHAAVRDHCGALDAADDATLVALRYSRGGQRDAAA